MSDNDNVPADELSQYYRSLSDEGLREIQRADLTEVARACYDAELASRGLTIETLPPEPEPSPDDMIEWAPLGTFTDEETQVVRALLDAQEIPSTMKLAPAENYPPVAAGSLLYVPERLLNKAREALASEISDEELIAEAEAEAPPEGA
jgi:hypothetical protein